MMGKEASVPPRGFQLDLLFTSVLATLPLVLLDLAASKRGTSGLERALCAPLLLTTGLWLGLVEVVALAWLGRLAGRLAAATAIRRPEWIFAILSSILLSPLYVWGTLQLFSGAGIRRSSMAGAGPWVVIPLTCLALIGAFRLFGRLRAQPPRAKRVLAVLPLALAIGALALDRRYLPDGYRYLHNTAAILAVVLAQAALDLAGLSPWARHPRAHRRAAMLMAILLVAMAATAVAANRVSFPTMLSSGKLYTGRATRLWRSVVDLDHDGFSPLWGGGDCSDLDSTINPLALDLPGNGVDEDCDGSDMAPAHARWLAASFPAKRWQPLLASPGVRNLVERTQGMSIVMITVDALRADYADGSHRPPTHAAAPLLNRSFSFLYAYAPSSSTRLSLPILQTSRLGPRAEDAKATLAARLSRLGYHTAVVSSIRPVRFTYEERRELHPPFDLREGFARVEMIPDSAGQIERPGGARQPQNEIVVQRALAVLRELRARSPFFLWVHLFDLHDWQEFTTAADGSSAARYEKFVDAATEDIRRLVDAIDKDPLAEKTIVVVCADHGEALGERQLLHHTRFVYDFLVHVPLLIRVPGSGSHTISTPVTLTDIAPTLIGLAGGGGCADCQGDPLLPVMVGGINLPQRAILLRDNDQVAVVQSGWKLLWAPVDQMVELYRLGNEDPDADLSSQYPEIARELRRLILYSPLRGLPPLVVLDNNQ